MASAHSATLPPPSTPKAPSPDRESLLSGGYGRGGHSPAAPAGSGSTPAPFGDHPASDGTHAQTRPPVSGHVGPVFTQPLYRTTLETLHKHSDTKPKIMANHPRTYKTSKELILPREIYHTPTNIKELEKEIGLIKKEKSKLRHILGIEHGNIPIQLDLWGNEVIFRGKGQTTLYGTHARYAYPLSSRQKTEKETSM
jgi:hypothetical protein